MKKLALLTALLGLAVSAGAQTKSSAPAPKPAPAPAPSAWSAPAQLPLGIQAVGWDGWLNHVAVRVGLSDNTAVDAGLRINIDTQADVTEFEGSGLFLLKLQDWGVVKNYAVAGGVVGFGEEFTLSGLAGLQPEITFLERFIVSVRFGLRVPVAPDFGIMTAGSPISLVNGVSFKIIW